MVVVVVFVILGFVILLLVVVVVLDIDGLVVFLETYIDPLLILLQSYSTLIPQYFFSLFDGHVEPALKSEQPSAIVLYQKSVFPLAHTNVFLF